MRRLLSGLSLAALCIFLLDACSSAPKHARYVPKDASVVVALNTGALSKKVAWSMITGSRMLDELKKKAPEGRGAAVAEDIGNAGIDWMSKLYFYARPDARFDNKAKMSLIMPLDDAGKWETFIRKTYPEVRISKVKDRSEAILGDKMYAGWTKDVVIINNAPVRIQSDTVLGPGDPDTAVLTVTNVTMRDTSLDMSEMEASFSLTKESSITGNDRFRQLDNDGHDIAVFMAYDALMDSKALQDGAGGMGMLANGTLWRNAALTAGIDFENGRITGDMRYYPSDSMRGVAREMGKTDIDKDLLDRIPAQNLNMAMAYHIAPDALKMMLDKMGLTGMANLALMQKGLSVDEVLGAFAGDMALAVNDFRMAPAAPAPMADTMGMEDMMPARSARPVGTFTYAVKLRDKAKLDKLLALLQSEMGLAPAAPNTYVFPVGADSVSALINDQYIVISNKTAAAQAFLQAKGSMPVLVKQEIAGHPAGMVMDVRSLAAAPARMPANGREAAALQELRNLFRTVSIKGGAFEGNANTYHMELLLTDTKENSLLQLLQFINRMAALQDQGAVVRR